MTPWRMVDLVGRMRTGFERWRTRDLSADAFVYLLCDGWYPKVRFGRQRARVPVLIMLGVKLVFLKKWRLCVRRSRTALRKPATCAVAAA